MELESDGLTVRMGSTSGCVYPVVENPENMTPLVAPAFAISEHDVDGSVLKTRRGDDWKRSMMNEAAVVKDKPSCHHVDYIVDGSKAARRIGKKKLAIWGHDHDGAYRQVMSSDPFLTMCILLTAFGPPSGPTRCCPLERKVGAS